MGHINQLQAKYADKGLLIVATERQGNDAAKIKNAIGGATYPVCAGGAGGYQGGKGIPYCFVVGVEGKVLYAGSPGGKSDTIIAEEIAKIKYPGLGQLDVAKGLEKAASSFITNKMDKSKEAVEKKFASIVKKAGVEDVSKLDESTLDEDAKAVLKDGKFILGRIDARLKSLQAKVEAGNEAKDYKVAYDALEAIEDQFGSKSEVGKKAKADAKAMKKDKVKKKEIKASTKFAELINDKKFKAASDKKKSAMLKSFIKSNKGTLAASRAEAKLPAEE